MGFTRHTMNRFTSLLLGALLAGVTSVPVQVDQSQYGPGPSAVPYRPRPAPGPYAAPPPERSYQPKPEGGYPGEQGSDYQRQGVRPAYRGQQAGERVYRESPAPQGPLPGPEYIPSGEQQQYLPEYVARVQ